MRFDIAAAQVKQAAKRYSIRVFSAACPGLSKIVPGQSRDSPGTKSDSPGTGSDGNQSAANRARLAIESIGRQSETLAAYGIYARVAADRGGLAADRGGLRRRA